MKLPYILFLISSITSLSHSFAQSPSKFQQAFEAINSDSTAREFQLSIDLQTHPLPKGYNGPHYHQQGIQKLPNGGFVISGSAKDHGYLYLTDAKGVVVSVITPEFHNEQGEELQSSGRLFR